MSVETFETRLKRVNDVIALMLNNRWVPSLFKESVVVRMFVNLKSSLRIYRVRSVNIW